MASMIERTAHTNSHPEECVICCCELVSTSGKVVFLTNESGKRLCNHYFHQSCIFESSKRNKSCPICRIKFVKFIEMPNPIENSSLWFKYANVDNDPELSKLEVINGLKATLPLDYTHLESEVNNCWSIWDINNSNSISLEEFTRPNTGLLAYILRHFQNHEPFSCLYCDQPINNKGGGVGVLCNEDGTRSCIHYFHSDCIRTQINNKNFSCLACNHPYKFSKLVPNPRTDPAGWFTIVDVNNDGKLNKTEVLEAIKSTLPVNWRRFEAQIFDDTDAEHNLWKKWDHDNNGFICKSEFIIPKNGLLDYLLDNFSIPDPNPIPKLTPGRRETYRTYFSYWDHPDNGGNCNGSLDKDEMRRAIIKTFRYWDFNLQDIDETIDTYNLILDPNGDGIITLEEFIQPDGWGDTICANMNH